MMLISQKPKEEKGGKRRIWSTNAVSFLIRTNNSPLDLTIFYNKAESSLNRITLEIFRISLNRVT